MFETIILSCYFLLPTTISLKRRKCFKRTLWTPCTQINDIIYVRYFDHRKKKKVDSCEIIKRDNRTIIIISITLIIY